MRLGYGFDVWLHILFYLLSVFYYVLELMMFCFIRGTPFFVFAKTAIAHTVVRAELALNVLVQPSDFSRSLTLATKRGVGSFFSRSAKSGNIRYCFLTLKPPASSDFHPLCSVHFTSVLTGHYGDWPSSYTVMAAILLLSLSTFEPRILMDRANSEVPFSVVSR